MKLLVKTSGHCEHDLSHLVIGLDYGYVSNLTNSANYKTEINSTDPKSGIYGFKIDDISNFGNNGDQQFTIEYEVCFQNPENENYLPDVIPIRI